MISHLLLHLQLLSCPYGQLFSSRLFNPHFDAVAILTDAQLLLSLSLVDSSLLAFLPSLEGYSKNISPKSSLLFSTQRNSFDFKMRGHNRIVLPSSDSIMLRIYRVQVEQLLRQLLTTALRFIMGYLVLGRNSKVAS